MKKLTPILAASVIFLIILVAVFVSKEDPQKKEVVKNKPLREVRIQTMWVPNGQFAAYYVAMEKGYFEAEGLKVSFNPYNEEVAVKDAVINGDADFGIDGADQVIFARSEGKKLKAISVNYRLNPTAFASLAEKNLKKLTDFVGHKIAILPDNTGTVFKTMLKKNGIREDQLTLVPYGYDFKMLYDGIVDVIPIYLFDEPYKLKKEGYSINILLPEDYGVEGYGDTLFTSDELIQKDPELVKKFLKASLKGWQYAIEHIDETAKIMLKYDHQDYKELEYEKFILTNQSPLVHTGEDYIGWMKPETWQGIYQMLIEQKMIKNQFPIEDAYEMKFLKEIYSSRNNNSKNN